VEQDPSTAALARGAAWPVRRPRTGVPPAAGAGAGRGVANATWVLGGDGDLPALAALLGGSRLGAVTIGMAIHWIRLDALFPAAVPLLRPDGGVAVIANGLPLWRYDTGALAPADRVTEHVRVAALVGQSPKRY